MYPKFSGGSTFITSDGGNLFLLYSSGITNSYSVLEKYSNDTFIKEYVFNDLIFPGNFHIGETFIIPDVYKSNIKIYNNADKKLINSIGSHGYNTRQFCNPIDVKSFGNNIMILDKGNNRLQLLRDNGEYLCSINKLYGMYSIYVNNNTIYIATNDGIYIYNSNFVLLKIHKYSAMGLIINYREDMLITENLNLRCITNSGECLFTSELDSGLKYILEYNNTIYINHSNKRIIQKFTI